MWNLAEPTAAIWIPSTPLRLAPKPYVEPELTQADLASSSPHLLQAVVVGRVIDPKAAGCGKTNG
jgi:hypothetical protein